MKLFQPTIRKISADDITTAELHSAGIKCLLLDVDNTLSTHGNKVPCEWVSGFISRMSGEGIKLIITSNAFKKRVAPFAVSIGLPYLYLCKKPLPFRLNNAVKKMGMKKSEVAIVGDQLFTDILGANLCGIKSILVSPIKPEKKLHFKIKRKLERYILNKYIK